MFMFEGRTFYLFRNVFSPLYYDSTFFYAKSLPIDFGSSVYEVGIGAGVISLHSLHRGARYVYGIDINPDAVNNSIHNARLNNLSNRTNFRICDIADLQGFYNCDVVFWSHPWVNMLPDESLSALGMSIFDHGYVGLRRYLSLISQAASGRFYLGFGNTGDRALLERLCSEYFLRFVLFDHCHSTMSPEYEYYLYEIVRSSR